MKYRLKLYIDTNNTNSIAVFGNRKKTCEEELANNYELEIIDIVNQSERAEKDSILAVPTLVKEHPLPIRKVIGNLSDRRKVMCGLDLLTEGKG